jgi:hypothetical protein
MEQIRTCFVPYSDAIQILYRCCTAIVQTLNRNYLVGIWSIMITRLLSSEGGTNTIRTQPEYIGARGKKNRLVRAKKADWIEKGLIE